MVNPALTNDPRCSAFIELKAHVETAQQSLNGDHARISVAIETVKQLFKARVQVLTWEDWPIQQRALLQSIRVEMHKQLRLLTTDLMFFKAAKQSETLEQRRKDIGDRLTNLQGYCDAILKLADEAKDNGANSLDTSREQK